MKDFKKGVLVWVKMKHYPPWPARIDFPADGMQRNSKKPQHFVTFFGTNDHAWVSDRQICAHSEEMLSNAKSYKKISCNLRTAIEEIERAFKKGEKRKRTTRNSIKTEPKPESPPPSSLDNSSNKGKKRKRTLKNSIKTEPESPPPSSLDNSSNKSRIIQIKKEPTCPSTSSSSQQPEENSTKKLKRIEIGYPPCASTSFSCHPTQFFLEPPRPPTSNSIQPAEFIAENPKKKSRIIKKKKPPCPSTSYSSQLPEANKTKKLKSEKNKEEGPSTSSSSQLSENFLEKQIRKSKRNRIKNEPSIFDSSQPDILPETMAKKSKKRPAPKIKIEMIPSNNSSESVAFHDLDEDYEEDSQFTLPYMAVCPPYGDGSNESPTKFTLMFMQSNIFSGLIPGLDSSPLKLENDFETNVEPTPKIIGFLGLGVMGCELIKRLLITRHSIIIWNRTFTPEYANFLQRGVLTVRTPACLVRECDIIFACLCDDHAVKSIMFGKNGIRAGFQELCSNKSYVELSSILPDTAIEVQESITEFGGRYLEAPMFGTITEVARHSILIHVAGDKETFDDCSTIFAAWAKKAIYLGCEIGRANKINVGLNMMVGVEYGALAESLAFVKKFNFDPFLFLELIKELFGASPKLLAIGRAMVTGDCTVHNPIRHQQKLMALALELGDRCNQPTPVTAAANQLYVRCKKRDRDSDVSAVITYL